MAHNQKQPYRPSQKQIAEECRKIRQEKDKAGRKDKKTRGWWSHFRSRKTYHDPFLGRLD